MARFDKIIIILSLTLLASLNLYEVLVKEKQKYEQGMTDMLDLCYDLGQATIQSKVTGKTIVCAALTDKHTL